MTRAYEDKVVVVTTKQALKSVYAHLLDTYGQLRVPYSRTRRLHKPAVARGFIRKGRAEIQVWNPHTYDERRAKDSAPMFTIYIHLDRLRADGVIRRLTMLWDEDPEYEIEDGQVVKYLPCTGDTVEPPSCTS